MTLRVLTGDRPTGSLHLGHYFGTLANRLRLQAQGHDLFVVVADYQVLADRDHPGHLRDAVLELVLDYLAAGLDPELTTVFPHSSVPELNQLMLPFLSLVSMVELQRNPTIKQEINLSTRASVSGLMCTYPVHQAADILFCQADVVPVGGDQLPHVELTRQIARRFNARYGQVFKVPEPMVGEARVLIGLDGRKMGKSLGNAIALRASADEVARAIRAARTDTEREITFEPHRRPQVAGLLTMAALCGSRGPAELASQVGSAGAGALKDLVIETVNDFLAPLHQRRASLHRLDAERLLAAGIARAREVAGTTLGQVRRVMGMTAGLDFAEASELT